MVTSCCEHLFNQRFFAGLCFAHKLDVDPILLKTPPDKSTLKKILDQLQLSPRDLMRRKENEYKENHLDDPSLSDDELIEAMLKYPKLIERPVVVTDKGAAIGRPPEKVLEVL